MSKITPIYTFGDVYNKGSLVLPVTIFCLFTHKSIHWSCITAIGRSINSPDVQWIVVVVIVVVVIVNVTYSYPPPTSTTSL